MATMQEKPRGRRKSGVLDDAEVLEELQDRMVKIARGGSPRFGRFCGYCYARLKQEDTACRVCHRGTVQPAPVEEVPDDVLRVYMAFHRKMQLWVNVFAFVGIFIAIVLAGLVLVFLPAAFKLLAVPVMLGGAWYFANLLGGGVGGHLGMKSGRAARARRWRAWRERQTVPTPA